MMALAWLQFASAVLLLVLTVWLLHEARADWAAAIKLRFEGGGMPAHRWARWVLLLSWLRVSEAFMFTAIGLLMVTRPIPIGTMAGGRVVLLVLTWISVAKMATDYRARQDVRRAFVRDPEQFISAQLIDALPDAVVMIDHVGCIRLVNAQCERLFGYRKRELVGHQIEVLVPQALRLQHERHRADYFTSPRAIESNVQKGRRFDGTEIDVEINLSALETTHGTYALAVVRKCAHDGHQGAK